MLKLLGKGNYGSALLVKDLRLPEPEPDSPTPESNLYVIKRVDLSGMPEPERKQAKQEVVLLKALNHPSIVHYFDSFIQDGHLHIQMEYCSRGDLGSMIKAARKAGRHFSEEQILDWFSQLAFALAFIHRKRILHRDIKSSNVFVTRANTCRLGDFGIARVLAHTMDAARTVLGSEFWFLSG